MEQGSPEWLEWRKGKITGSKVKGILVKRGSQEKVGFYDALAERLAVEVEGDDPEELPINRGHRLEEVALSEFTEYTGIKVKDESVVWVSDDSDFLTLSPDGVVSPTKAVEVKCLKSGLHIQAYIEGKIPSDYTDQALMYFIVNEKLKTLYFVFYDPRVPSKPFHHIELNRSELKDDIDLYKAQLLDKIKRMDEIINKLTF
jgi:predicted phage-related endonuclease